MVAIGEKNPANAPASQLLQVFCGGFDRIDAEVGSGDADQIAVEVVPMRLREPGPGEDIFEDLPNALLYLHSLPKRNASLDLLGVFFRLRVIPGRVLVRFSVYDHVVVARLALPRAGRMRAARLEIFSLDRAGWEIVVVFKKDGIVTVRNDGVVPKCFHGILLMCFYQRKGRLGIPQGFFEEAEI